MRVRKGIREVGRQRVGRRERAKKSWRKARRRPKREKVRAKQGGRAGEEKAGESEERGEGGGQAEQGGREEGGQAARELKSLQQTSLRRPGPHSNRGGGAGSQGSVIRFIVESSCRGDRILLATFFS